jgi:hypothetical protein
MSQVDALQLFMIGGLLFKLSLAIIGSFRGWKGWPWAAWLGVEIVSGLFVGAMESSGIIGPMISLLAIFIVGIITLITLIYMACKSRYSRNPPMPHIARS